MRHTGTPELETDRLLLRRLLPQDAPQQRVGLSQHGRGRLGQNLGTHELGHFKGNIRVGNARFSGLHILSLDAQVGCGIFETILQRAEMRADFVLCDNGVVNSFQGLLG